MWVYLLDVSEANICTGATYSRGERLSTIEWDPIHRALTHDVHVNYRSTFFAEPDIICLSISTGTSKSACSQGLPGKLRVLGGGAIIIPGGEVHRFTRKIRAHGEAYLISAKRTPAPSPIPPAMRPCGSQFHPVEAVAFSPPFR